MHCYEYLAMHMQLKSALKREFPNEKFDQLELDELLGSMGISSFQELTVRMGKLGNRSLLKLSLAVTTEPN